MKNNLIRKLAGLALAAFALGSAAECKATTFLTTSYTNSFPIGGNTSDFTGGSAASWIYWYNTPGGNTAMYVDVGISADDTNTYGALEMDSPFQGVSGTQNVIFGTFDNQWGYDFNEEANLTLFTNITFDIMVPKGTPPTANGDFGTIGVGVITSGYGFESMGYPTIPGAASNGWVHISVPINQTAATLNNIPGLAFQIANYGGYPSFNFTNYLDNIELHLSPVQLPPPILSGKLTVPTPGLNVIATAENQPYNRYQVRTVANSGLGFVGQPSVTYSWNVQAFPKNAAPETFQQHFFIADGIPGPYDEAIDYNFANVLIMTVQESASGAGTFNFSYKTNEPAGNGMVYNGTSPTNTTANPNGWPIMPVCSLTAASPVGDWSVTFANSTNVTITGPGGATTNFVLDAASAALFTDPVTLCLGGQPNAASGFGEGVVYGSFAVTGNAAPFSDDFLTDSSLNTNLWADLSNDPNGDILVPQGSAYWLTWSVPDSGFSLLVSSNLTGSAFSWADLTPTTIENQGTRQALIPAASLPGGNQAYFRLIERTFTQLQVLLPGETNAPGTVTGKTGTPTPESVYGLFSVTVNACDSTWHILSSSDSINLVSATDPSAGNNTGTLVNGTAQIEWLFDTAGSQTVTASDTTTTNILSNTSSSVTAQ